MILFVPKAIILAMLIIYYLISSMVISMVFRDRKTKLKILSKNLSLTSKLTLFNLGIKVETINDTEINESCLILSNHLSYLDILIIASRFPSTFITSFEVRNTKFLGTLSSFAGSIFVDRTNPGNIRNEINEIKGLLIDDIQMVLFPEATSSNGDTVLPFRSGLLECIANTEKKILLISLNYKKLNNRPISEQNRDLLCWYGDMPFFPHLTKLLMQGRILVYLSVIVNLSPSGKRKEIANTAHRLIKETYLKRKDC